MLLMEVITTAMQPFERIFMDIMEKLSKIINDSEQLLTIPNDLTKFIYAIYQQCQFKISNLQIK